MALVSALMILQRDIGAITFGVSAQPPTATELLVVGLLFGHASWHDCQLICLNNIRQHACN